MTFHSNHLDQCGSECTKDTIIIIIDIIILRQLACMHMIMHQCMTLYCTYMMIDIQSRTCAVKK